MVQKLWTSPSVRAESGLRMVRIILGLIIVVHPLHRTFTGSVPGFGEYLDSIGYPFGVAVAWLITIAQILSSIALIFGRFIVPSCLVSIVILLVGIVLVHYPEGWFVVGGGTNGMEYSFMLIACLTGLAWAHWPSSRSKT